MRLTRAQILTRRRRVQHLDTRLSSSARSLRRAAWAGLQDSMPRAALLSLHARVRSTPPDVLDDPSLVQVWGPRFSVYVVAEQDRALFTVGRHPDSPKAHRRAHDLADRLADLIGDEATSFAEVGHELGTHPNAIRYATTTGRVLVHWDGANRPTIRMVPAPDMDPATARRELARRFLHVFGPSTEQRFGAWAGITAGSVGGAFADLDVVDVRTPIGDAQMLAEDLDTIGETDSSDGVRLLPSGDTYYLHWGEERELLVPDADRQGELWTSRVWPGAVLVDGEIVGTWRRSQHQVAVTPWRRLSAATKSAIEAEAAAFPLPGVEAPITVTYT